MIYQIFRNNIEVVQVKPLDSSELSQKKQEEDLVRLNFTLTDYIDIRIGDYIGFERTGMIYTLNKKPRVIDSPNNYYYECIFEGPVHELHKTKVLLQTSKTGGGFYQDYKFPLTGNAQSFLSFIVDNLNRVSSGYTIGTFKTTETITVQFNNWSVFEAITELSTILGFDWYMDGKELHFDSKGYQTSYVFQVGRFKGFKRLTRTRVESEDLQTVVYGYGSTENLPPRENQGGVSYDGETLTENRLSFNGIDGFSKLENNTDKFGIIESVKEFPDIKPQRIGIVTGLTGNLNQFIDADIDFDVEDQKLPGITPKVTFLSGKLIGFTFEAAFVNSSKVFTLNNYTDESGTYPSTTISISAGDTYILTDLIMPNTYIEDAQNRLEVATQEYLNEKSNNLDLYEGEIDEAYISELGIELNLGDLVRVVSPVFLIDNLYEIKSLVQKITDPNVYSIKFGDILPKGLLTTLKNANFATQQEIFNIQNNIYTKTQINNQTTNIIGDEVAWKNL